MKRNLFLYGTYLLLWVSLINTDCNRCWKNECADPVAFDVTDANGNNMYFGNKATLIPDSVYILSAKNNQFKMMAWGYSYDSVFRVPEIQSSDTFFVSNQGDIDTMALKYRYENTECCTPYYHIQSVTYNGREASIGTNGRYICRKY